MPSLIFFHDCNAYLSVYDKAQRTVFGLFVFDKRSRLAALLSCRISRGRRPNTNMVLKQVVTKRYGTKHLLFIDAQNMLVLFACATMLQFLFNWRVDYVLATVIESSFLVLSFVLYVLCRIIKNPYHRDIIVLLAFASLLYYRVLGVPFVTDNFDAATSTMSKSTFVESSSNKARKVGFTNHWIVVSMFFCTGLHLKLLFGVVFLAFVGLVLEASFTRDWGFWAVDIPLYIHFSFIGFLYYYAFFCLGIEICRLRHRPLRSIRDLPLQCFYSFECRALSSLPITVLAKTLSREEHLYILLRITQTTTFREAALQLIGENPEFEASLGDKDKLERAFLRTALVQFHLKECLNRSLKPLATLLNPTAPLPNTITRSGSASAVAAAGTTSGTARNTTFAPTAFTTHSYSDDSCSPAAVMMDGRHFDERRWRRRHEGPCRTRKAYLGQLNFFRSASSVTGNSSLCNAPDRGPLEALASKIAVNRTRTSEAPTLLSRPSRSVARGSEYSSAWREPHQSDSGPSGHARAGGKCADVRLAHCYGPTGSFRHRYPTARHRRRRQRHSRDRCNGNGCSVVVRKPSSPSHTVTVGSVTFPKLDVERANSRRHRAANTSGVRQGGGGWLGRASGDTRRGSKSVSKTRQWLSSVRREKPRRACCVWQRSASAVFPAPKKPPTVAQTTELSPCIAACGLPSTYGPRDSSRSFHRFLEHRFLLSDELLNHTGNPLGDPITVQDDVVRLRVVHWPFLRRCSPWMKQAVSWISGVEAIMTKAQWRHIIHIPKRTAWGSFVDTKIERWFLTWVSPVQARQHIFLSTLVLIVTCLNVGMTWNIYIVDALHYASRVHATQGLSFSVVMKQCILYLSVRTAVHLSLFLGVISLQNTTSYYGYLNSHFYKRRASFLAVIGLLVSLLDTAMHQLLIPGGPPTLHFVVLAAVTFPIFSQLTTATQIWMAAFMIVGLLLLLPLFIRNLYSAVAAVEAIVFASLGVLGWFIFISRCVLVNYRYLFCRYVLPYLLYLDALQPIQGGTATDSSDDSSSLSSGSASDMGVSSNISSYTNSSLMTSFRGLENHQSPLSAA